MAEAPMYNGVALVGYVDGTPVDANGNEVKGAPALGPDTDPAQQPHAMAALNSEERSAAILANALAVALGKAPAGSPGAAPAATVELPTLAVLPDVLAAMGTVEQVRALEAQDDRKGARALYEARITELTGA